MIKSTLTFSLLSLAFALTTSATENPAMHDAEGAGKVFLPDGRPVIRFDAAAPKGASATWTLKSPLEPGWHTVELAFGPEQNSR